ncbi:MAG: hypothetical protein J5713_04215 [Clostridia bacterium]|nr:hypothetical protein [Clostridia bacterium]
MAYLEKIENDLFDIADRLKEIDDRYVLYFNKTLWRFEIHANGVLQLAVPFDRLDARTLFYARETRLENMRKLVERMDKENDRLDKIKRQKIIDDCLAKAEV